jgi:hypothetical protein
VALDPFPEPAEEGPTDDWPADEEPEGDDADGEADGEAGEVGSGDRA